MQLLPTGTVIATEAVRERLTKSNNNLIILTSSASVIRQTRKSNIEEPATINSTISTAATDSYSQQLMTEVPERDDEWNRRQDEIS